MKKSKLLFLTPCVALATITPIVSCQASKSEAEKIADAIFDPSEKQASKMPKTTIIESVASLSQEDQQKEIIYDLCSTANNQKHNFKQMYKDNDVALATNITKCSMKYENNKLYATFLGYVSFVFQNEKIIEDKQFKLNDYIMYTFDFKDIEITQGENPYSLKYQAEADASLGFAKIRWNGGSQEALYDLTGMIDTSTYSEISWPVNSNNWNS